MTENPGNQGHSDELPTHDSSYAEGVPQHGELPDEIDGFRILKRLGQGGMGEVFLAQQDEPVRRQVALKIIRQGAPTKQVLARFEQERQALAMLNHEYIAKVFGAGVTREGQPYFVMESVEGTALDQYCDDHRLTIQERVELFRKICGGVQHAHAKGVMHRDLKPSNVLVVEREGTHTPKIIDFGLARATDQQLIDQTLVTEQGLLLGTPEYMSPEQARGDAQQLDTRTDVYSLGVLLYQLLCGQLPFPAEQLRREGLLRVQAIISEEEPKKPSTRVTGVDEASRSEIARARGLELRTLTRFLTGDLDWIVMRAMAKEPERRYSTPDGLADDLRRFLQYEPVEAGPPTFGYRFSKFVRKNRLQVTAAALVFLALAGGIAASLVFANRAVSSQELASRRADDLQVQTDQYDQLSGVVIYDRALARVDDLIPAWPETVPLIDKWMQGDVAKLRALRPQIRETLLALRGQALPSSEDERRRPRRTHPKWPRYERLVAELAELEAADRVYRGAPIEKPAVPDFVKEMALPMIDGAAWARVAPDDPERVLGEAPMALACAELAIERARAAGHPDLAQFVDTLAWAQLRAGLIDQCLATSKESLQLATSATLQAAQVATVQLRSECEAFPFAVRTTRRALAELDRELPPVFTLEFADDAESGAQGFLYSTLERLDRDLESFFRCVVPEVEERRDWASQIGSLCKNHPNASATWEDVTGSLRASGDNDLSPAYREWFSGTEALAIEPQEGLVPIGINPVTRLWEFYQLRSAWDGRSDPAALAIPQHDESGDIVVEEGSGMVFVLLPGGTFLMGVQKTDPSGANYDHWTEKDDEQPPHEIRLRPFFLSRHEMTKRQWLRLSQGQRPSGVPLARVYRSDFVVVDGRFPVENVFWRDSNAMLREQGLELPTEAQWEFACRAGTSTPWSTGDEPQSLDGYANVEDTAAKRAGAFGARGVGEFDDGFVNTAPVGSFEPNAFGLFDMHGNVREWCRDGFGQYEDPVREGDGLRLRDDGTNARVLRGGSFVEPPRNSRSGFRDRVSGDFRNLHVGVRAARSLR